jgi:hypothetical protein
MNLHPLLQESNRDGISFSLISKAKQPAGVNIGEQPGNKVLEHERTCRREMLLKIKRVGERGRNRTFNLLTSRQQPKNQGFQRFPGSFLRNK